MQVACVLLRSSRQSGACTAGWASGRASRGTGPMSRARHREAGDVPAGTRSRSGSLRGPRWSGRKQASPVGRDSAPLWSLSRGFSEVRLPRGCRRPGHPSKSSSRGPRRPPSSPLHLAHPPRCARPSSCGRKPRAAGASARAPGSGFPSARGLLATRLPHSAPSAPHLARPRAEGAARAPHAAGWAGGGHPAGQPRGLTGLAGTPGTLSLPRAPISFLTPRSLLLLLPGTAPPHAPTGLGRTDTS